MKIVKEFVENYLYYYNELIKNKLDLQNNRLLLKVGKTSMHTSRDAILALIDFYNDFGDDEKIVYKG